jgi:isopentenyldiphosphate isomerase
MNGFLLLMKMASRSQQLPGAYVTMAKAGFSTPLFPGYWDTSVGGHLSPGEGVEDALKRETLEELGLRDFEYSFKKKYIWESPRERELVYSFTGNTSEIPLPNKDEIEEGRYWTLEEIKDKIGKDFFTPNFEHEFGILIES